MQRFSLFLAAAFAASNAAAEQTPDCGFIHAIFNSPNGDLPRLVFADFLDETGRPDQAEILRYEVEIHQELTKSQTSEKEDERQESSRRVKDLAKRRDAIVAKLGPDAAALVIQHDTGYDPFAMTYGADSGLAKTFFIPVLSKDKPRVSFKMGGVNGTDTTLELGKGLYKDAVLVEMGVFPVTQAQAMAVIGRNPSYNKDGIWRWGPETLNPFHPANMSYDEAVEMTRALNQIVSNASRGELRPEYIMPPGELWEYAASGGKDTPFFLGNDRQIEMNAWIWTNANVDNYRDDTRRTQPVGRLRHNKLGGEESGLFDTSGNVWEWTSSLYQSGQPWGVLRGGSWLSDPGLVRSGHRYSDRPGLRLGTFGFRLARIWRKP